MGVAAGEGALEAETALTMKLNGAENSAGPASRRRDNIGAPARPAATHNNTHSERLETRAGLSDCWCVSKQERQRRICTTRI